MKKKTKPKAKPAKKPLLKECIAAREKTDRHAKRIADMTPAERRNALAKITKDLAKHHPGLAVAKSDLLALLQLVGTEFTTKYFPTATHASFHASDYSNPGRSSPPSVMISLMKR